MFEVVASFPSSLPRRGTERKLEAMVRFSGMPFEPSSSLPNGERQELTWEVSEFEMAVRLRRRLAAVKLDGLAVTIQEQTTADAGEGRER